MADKTRICWPDPDATCLEGGCIYCHDAPERSLSVVTEWARHAGQVKNRGDAKTKDALTALKFSGRA